MNELEGFFSDMDLHLKNMQCPASGTVGVQDSGDSIFAQNCKPL